MTRTAVITQPTYLPWLGYFEQMLHADIYVVLDSVQFETRSWQCRNRLKGPDGEVFWLTVPIAKHAQETAICDICIAPQEHRWREKHLRSIQRALGRAQFFPELFPKVEDWLRTPYERLADMNQAGIELFARLLGLSPKIVRASQLAARGSKAELMANICREVGANHYFVSVGSREYLEEGRNYFDEAGVQVEFQSWQHPAYSQQGVEFVSHLPALDALMNVGPAATRDLIQATEPSRQFHE